jgi:hypothetical protein
MADEFDKTVEKLTKAVDKLPAAKSSGGNVEKEREQAARENQSNEYLKTIANVVSSSQGGGGDADAKKAGKKGGLLAGIGGALGGMGVGAGVAMAGMGALFAGGGYLLKQIAEFDGKAVVANVKELAKIADIADGIGGALSKGGSFLIMMTGIGAGLAAFSIGAGVAAAVTYFTKGTKWAETVVKNVTTLIGIQSVKGYASFKTTEFTAVMTGIGAGLFAFAIGTTAITMAQTLTRFTGGEDWAKTIVKNVTTLIGIQSVKGYDSFGYVKFTAVMGGIAVGLIAFAFGEAATNMAGTLTRFTGGEDWAKTIVKNVTTLIGIQDVKGYDSFRYVKFAAVMLGIGLGLVAFSIGKVAASMATAFTQFTDTKDWAKEIIDNITTLVGIQNIPGYDSFGATGFAATMLGIGLGLVAFSIGKVAASMTTALTQFTGVGNWAQIIVDNVTTLVGIQYIMGYDSFSPGGFAVTMGAIALGLIAFSVGKVAASMTTALTQFTDTKDWAMSIYDNVETLVSIKFIPGYDSFGKTKFIFTMGAIALGLIAFALGEGATGMAQSLTKFTETGNWAMSIYDNVATLVSISSIPDIGKDTAKFAAVMAGLAAGLVAFAIGKGASGAAEAVTKFSGGGKEGDFADRIKKQVVTLLSILNDPNVDQKKADSFSSIMGTISQGLLKFSGGTFLSGLAGAATKVMSFLTGSKSPVQQMTTIAKNAEQLKQGAIAIGAISENLDKVGNLKFKGGDLGIQDFAEDLLKAIPDIEVAIKGGKVSTGIFSGTTIKGLGSKDIPWGQAGKNLRIIHEALNVPKGDQGSSADALKGDSGWQDKLQKSIEDLTAAIGAGGGGGPIIGGTTINAPSSPTNVIGQGVTPRQRTLVIS